MRFRGKGRPNRAREEARPAWAPRGWAGNLGLSKRLGGGRQRLFFDSDGPRGPSLPQPSVWEPRENRGRLRHCNGLQTPTATGLALQGREGGSEVSGPKSGYRFGCARRGCNHSRGRCRRGVAANFSDKRRMRPARARMRVGVRWMPSFSDLPGLEGILLFSHRAGLSTNNPARPGCPAEPLKDQPVCSKDDCWCWPWPA